MTSRLASPQLIEASCRGLLRRPADTSTHYFLPTARHTISTWSTGISNFPAKNALET